MSDWIEVRATFAAEPEDWALWHEIFACHGIAGTVQWERPFAMSGYLVDGSSNEIQNLTDALNECGAVSVAHNKIKDEDWSQSWKQFFKPRVVGKKWMIRPTWEECEDLEGRTEIVLDPGQAFGTGDHPTTRLCLELMETLQIHRQTVADIGCGSGVLSIAAGKQGARLIDAVDIDGVAVEATRLNAARNGIALNTFQGEGFLPISTEAQYNLILTNLISAVIIRLCPEIQKRLAPNGYWIASGILHANWCDVHGAAVASGLRVAESKGEGDWIAAIFHR